jgi:hypothetical protein
MDVETSPQVAESVTRNAIALSDFLASNDWLNAYIPAIIGAVGGGVVVAGTITWAALKFMVRARQMKKEYKAAYGNYCAEKSRADKLHADLEKTREVVVVHGILFARHDPSPHYPLCPACHADGKIIRMSRHNDPEIEHPPAGMVLIQETGDGNPKVIKRSEYASTFICLKCQTKFFIDDPEATEKLFKQVEARLRSN